MNNLKPIFIKSIHLSPSFSMERIYSTPLFFSVESRTRDVNLDLDTTKIEGE